MAWKDTRGDWSQRNQRAETDFTDQHGRKYHATIEVKTGDPCGLIEPLFTAPIMPPQAHLKRVPRKPYDLRIDYAAWKAEIREAWAEWQRAGRSHSRKLHGDAYDPRKPFTGEVLEIIGPAPTPIDPVIAAEQGNKWVLGLTDRVDIRLAKFFEPEQLDPNYSDPDEEDYTDLDDELDEQETRSDSRTAPKTDRNAAIAQALEDGASVKKLAKRYGVSESRIREIGRKAKELAGVA